MKLTARRGQFPFLEDFGSRLWTLGQLRPAERQAAAEQYVRGGPQRMRPG